MNAQAVTRQAIYKKSRLVEEITRFIKKYPVIATFNLTGVRANTLHEMRRKLRGLCEIRVLKKKLFMRACREANKPELEKLVENVKEPLGFIFSNINSLKLALILEKSKVPMFAKAGERADFDVWVPETNTGLPPGPILSDFGKLKIPTRIEAGQVWIARDTLVAKKGDEISQLLASLLVKLGIKAVLRGITILNAYDDGVIFSGSDLLQNFEKIGVELRNAISAALHLSLNISYISKETLPLLLVKASREAMALAVETGYYSRETITLIISRAVTEATFLAKAAGLV